MRLEGKGYKINAKADSAEVWIYDDIGEGWVGGISAKAFVEDLNKIKAAGTLSVRINSEGGNVFDGLTIYNALKRHPARVVVDVDGLAASIASVIAMAGDEIRMAANSFMMIHDPWVVTGGTADELRTMAETMDKVRAKLLDTYVGRAGDERAVQLDSMMAAETWLTAEEALEAGLIDKITNEMRVAARINHPDRYKHAPEMLSKRDDDTKVKLLHMESVIRKRCY